MDPITLAGAAVTLLVPFLKRIAEGAADRLSESAAEAAMPAAGRLLQGLRRRLRPGSYEGNQLEGVEAQPEREGRQNALRSALIEALESDPDFAAELEPLVREADAEAGNVLNLKDSGAAAGRDLKIEGHYAAGRDINLGKGV